MTLEDLWRQKSDKELEIAARELADYREDAQKVIRNEMMRRGMVAPDLPPKVQPPTPPQPSRQKLLDAFRLTEEDLVANRQGMLTKRQKKMLVVAAKDEAVWATGFALIFGLVMYGILYILVQEGQIINLANGISSVEEIVLLGVTGVLPTFFLIQAVRIWLIYRRSSLAKQVMTTDGAIELEAMRLKYGVMVYQMIVGKSKFGLTPVVYNLLKTGNLCRIYYEPITQSIVAIEPIEKER
ncbi:MAG TPA: hypothetical protein IGS52_10700 [Oscillatoriaceae cyanobacterium M33_DOE_052]|uniref:Uncharacterized protein n=1 Tax=Planktothricoides sp. SpSt-374 TaxID=2282167 RepID=A0A7C3VNA5_9CYAN|nr:hypothetical protein [Oscillatoriaceae cyanobacterium M33_DOE_052]